MMLRGSMGDADVNLQAIVDGAGADSHVPAGAALIQLVDAALSNPAALPKARDAVASRLGATGVVDAACVIGNFMRMVRIADGTGIPIDARMVDPSAEVRDALGLNSFASARLPD